MNAKALPALLVVCIMLVSGCGTSDDEVAYRYEGSTEAALSDNIIGRPLAEAWQAAGGAPSVQEQLPDGSQVLIWTRANVHRGLGEAVSCQERITALGGVVQSYSRIGDGC